MIYLKSKNIKVDINTNKKENRVKEVLKNNGNDMKKLFYFEKNIFYVTEYDGVHKFLTYD